VADLVVEVIADRMGSDILLLDLTDVTLIADYFVIATAQSERQLGAIAQELARHLKEQLELTAQTTDGTPASGWIAIDLGGVVVHLFTEAMRARYQLEEFWQDARTIVRLA